MTRSFAIMPSVLSLAALPLLALPAAAQDAGASISPQQISACMDDRQAAGCSTLLVRVMVCDQAPAIEGCEAINQAAEDAENLPGEDEEASAADDIEPDVEVRAEGELGEPEDQEPLIPGTGSDPLEHTSD